jgi:hypothetical protein
LFIIPVTAGVFFQIIVIFTVVPVYAYQLSVVSLSSIADWIVALPPTADDRWSSFVDFIVLASQYCGWKKYIQMGVWGYRPSPQKVVRYEKLQPGT